MALEPRENYPRLWRRKQPWMRMDPELEGVWSVTCFVVRKGRRQSGLTYELAAATVDYGQQVGARVLVLQPYLLAVVRRVACVRLGFTEIVAGVTGEVDVSEVEAWALGLAEVHARIAPRFARSEPRERVLAYVRGLLAPASLSAHIATPA